MTSINNDAPFIDMSSSPEPAIQRPLADLPGQSVMDAIVLAVDALLAARKRLASIDPDWDQGHLFPIALEVLNAAPTALRALLSSPASILPGNAFTPTHRHIKTGGEYEYVGGARIQSEVPLNDMDEVAVYLGRDGDLWARRQSEFNTARFESLPEAPLPPEDPYIAELEAEKERLRDSSEPMACDPDKWTAAEEVLAHLLINVIGAPDDVTYTPNEAQEIIERQLKQTEAENAALNDPNNLFLIQRCAEIAEASAQKARGKLSLSDAFDAFTSIAQTLRSINELPESEETAALSWQYDHPSRGWSQCLKEHVADCLLHENNVRVLIPLTKTESIVADVSVIRPTQEAQS